MRALIFSGGEFTGLPDDFDLRTYDLIIAADKGYLYAEKLGITPHIFVGDRDSLPKGSMIFAEETVLLPTVKDMTDTQEAIDVAVSHGADHITMLAALGGRIDHALANLHLLKYGLSKGVKTELADKESFVTLIEKPETFSKKTGYCLSLIPLTPCRHVSVSGVYYPLSDADMELGNPYGVSNEFTEDTAYVDPGTGSLFVIICKSS